MFAINSISEAHVYLKAMNNQLRRQPTNKCIRKGEVFFLLNVHFHYLLKVLIFLTIIKFIFNFFSQLFPALSFTEYSFCTCAMQSYLFYDFSNAIKNVTSTFVIVQLNNLVVV